MDICGQTSCHRTLHDTWTHLDSHSLPDSLSSCTQWLLDWPGLPFVVRLPVIMHSMTSKLTWTPIFCQTPCHHALHDSLLRSGKNVTFVSVVFLCLKTNRNYESQFTITNICFPWGFSLLCYMYFVTLCTLLQLCLPYNCIVIKCGAGVSSCGQDWSKTRVSYIQQQCKKWILKYIHLHAEANLFIFLNF